MGGGPFDMTRDADGVWMVTTPPAVPGFHYYWLLVDGFNANDPSSETYFGYGRHKRLSRCPNPARFPTSRRTCRTATCDNIRYYSKITGTWRRAFVYLPPGYDASARAIRCCICSTAREKTREGWTKQGRANFILDNLVAAKRAAPDDRGHGLRVCNKA